MVPGRPVIRKRKSRYEPDTFSHQRVDAPDRSNAGHDSCLSHAINTEKLVRPDSQLFFAIEFLDGRPEADLPHLLLRGK
jgi:hypothetical protein